MIKSVILEDKDNPVCNTLLLLYVTHGFVILIMVSRVIPLLF